MLIDFVGRRFFYLVLSGLIVIPGVVALLIPPALRPGIEFTSGTLMTLRFTQEVEQSMLRNALTEVGYSDAIIQRNSDGDHLVRTRVLREEIRDPAGGVTTPSERQELIKGLEQRFGSVTVLSFDQVSPIVAQEIAQKSFLAVVVASVFILLYISFAFRQVPTPFRYGISAIVALIHDVLVVLGSFSIFGKVFGTEIDSMFITAVLTVIGFSVHDTIVVFDRTRENLRRLPGRDLGTVVNVSLNQTLARSLSTSLTVVLTLVALLVFGGVTMRNFVLTLLIGIASGTYSSIFIASQMLVMWEYGELNPARWFGRGAQPSESAGAGAPVRSR